jgi:hypothetical protein
MCWFWRHWLLTGLIVWAGWALKYPVAGGYVLCLVLLWWQQMRRAADRRGPVRSGPALTDLTVEQILRPGHHGRGGAR